MLLKRALISTLSVESGIIYWKRKFSDIFSFQVFDLVNNENVEETKRLIETYKKDNNEDIKRNRIKKSQEMEYLDELIREEQSLHDRVRKEEDEEKELLRSQKQDKERMIDELMISEGSASAIVKQHVANTVTSLQARELGDTVQVNIFHSFCHYNVSYTTLRNQ